MSRSPGEVYGGEASILITGASSGIGAALAEHLARYGGKLALVARRRDRLEEVAQRVEAAGGRPLAVEADVTDLEGVKAAHQRVLREQGAVDVAFLNAGVSDFIFLKRFEIARFRRLFEVNVFGVLNWLESLIPEMIDRGQGIIAATSSLAADRGMPGQGGYSATKAAVSKLLDNMRPEAKRYGIQISIIEPGFVRTEISKGSKMPLPFLLKVDEAARLMADSVAQGRSVIRFPWQLSGLSQILRNAPAPIYDGLAGLMHKQHKKRA